MAKCIKEYIDSFVPTSHDVVQITGGLSARLLTQSITGETFVYRLLTTRAGVHRNRYDAHMLALHGTPVVPFSC